MPLNSQATLNLAQNAKLFVVATPLGNTDDLSPRARHTLENVDFVLAEDTRRAGILCQRCHIKVKRFMSFHDHNEKERCQEVLSLLQEGQSAALISDAGTPLMADPGYRLVRACREAHIAVSMVPGPSAPIAALMAAGIAPQPFTFLGFLPRDAVDQEKVLAPFIPVQSTLVFFERKDRLHTTLALAYSLFGARDMAIARELTKTHEEFILGSLQDYASIPKDLKGEITVILGPPLKNQEKSPKDAVKALLQEELQKGGKPRQVARRVQAQVTGWSSKEIYLLASEESAE